MGIYWKPPSIEGAAQFAYWEGCVFGYVTSTAFKDKRWRIAVFPHGKDDSSTFGGYAPNERKAKLWLERWAKKNHKSITSKPVQTKEYKGTG